MTDYIEYVYTHKDLDIECRITSSQWCKNAVKNTVAIVIKKEGRIVSFADLNFVEKNKINKKSIDRIIKFINNYYDNKIVEGLNVEAVGLNW